MAAYLCNDGNAEMEITADSAREAAEEYVRGGDWGEIETTAWIDVRVVPVGNEDDAETVTVTLEPREPKCAAGEEHDWQSPYEVLGGLRENPGVRSKGGGAVYREVCAHCGTYRVTDTWAQKPGDGQQGLTSVRYEDADEKSLAWVEARR